MQNKVDIYFCDHEGCDKCFFKLLASDDPTPSDDDGPVTHRQQSSIPYSKYGRACFGCGKHFCPYHVQYLAYFLHSGFLEGGSESIRLYEQPWVCYQCSMALIEKSKNYFQSLIADFIIKNKVSPTESKENQLQKFLSIDRVNQLEF